MFLPRKQKPHDDDPLTPRVWTWYGTRSEEIRRSKTGTSQFAEFSRLSARMLELSLLQAQNDPTLRGTVPNKVTPASWPFLEASIGAQKLVQPSVESTGRAGMVAGKANVDGTAHLNSQPHGTLREWRSLNFAVPYSWTALLIGHWSKRSARRFQFVIDRISARVKILTQLKPLQRLKLTYAKLGMFMARAPVVYAAIRNKVAPAKRYRCRDCGGKIGFRSRPHNSMERYILPLLLTRAVRCAECFRRDYRLIFTPVRERSSHHDETTDRTHRNAA